jgi:hypothetical protein
MLRFHYTSLMIIIFLLSGCGQTNYLLKSDTPPILERFYGFRWTTPMSVVDSEFPKQTGAKPVSILNYYNTSNFSDAYFLDELTSLCKFTFNETGFKSVKILFNTNHLTFENELFKLKEKLTAVYGEPIESLGIIEYLRIPEYLIRYSWNERRLEITLKFDYSIEINAYSYSPLHGPIFRTK